MTLYAVQKFLYELNRSETAQNAYTADRRGVLEPYELTDEEIEALVEPDIGKLFHLGVNGQILMHFAAFHQIEWQDYLQRMRDGIAQHGPVREGVYAMTTGLDEVVAPVHTPAETGTDTATTDTLTTTADTDVGTVTMIADSDAGTHAVADTDSVTMTADSDAGTTDTTNVAEHASGRAGQNENGS